MSVSSQIKLYKHSPNFFCVGEDDQPYALRMLFYKCVIDHKKEIELIQWNPLSKLDNLSKRYCSIEIQMIRWIFLKQFPIHCWFNYKQSKMKSGSIQQTWICHLVHQIKFIEYIDWPSQPRSRSFSMHFMGSRRGKVC